MNRVRVKICGITRVEDAERAVEYGADAIGFIFAPSSPRTITPDAAKLIARSLPAFITRIGVFVDAPPAEIEATVDLVGLDGVQLHGDEDIDRYRAPHRRIVRALALDDKSDVVAAAALPPDVLPLVDASAGGRRGGTGRTANWPLAAALARHRRVILAGGLTPENVADAMRQVRPWAVDVSSGVESATGVKSPAKLREFLMNVLAMSEEDA